MLLDVRRDACVEQTRFNIAPKIICTDLLVLHL